MITWFSFKDRYSLLNNKSAAIWAVGWIHSSKFGSKHLKNKSKFQWFCSNALFDYAAPTCNIPIPILYHSAQFLKLAVQCVLFNTLTCKQCFQINFTGMGQLIFEQWKALLYASSFIYCCFEIQQDLLHFNKIKIEMDHKPMEIYVGELLNTRLIEIY